MAQKRMIDKKISVSEQVASLSIEAQLIFTWSIPHADDVGLLPFSSRTLKAMIVPMWDSTVLQFEAWIQEIVSQGLWKVVKQGDKPFYVAEKFRGHQTLKRDRQPQTLLEMAYNKDPRLSWVELDEILEDMGFQMEDIGIQLETEEKRREVKRSEDNNVRDNKTSKISQNADFDLFWSKYPRKINKSKASKAWEKIKPDQNLLDTILTSLEKHKLSLQWTKDDGQFIPHASTWLNARRWEDELPGAPKELVTLRY